MSDASARGKDLETRVAREVRRIMKVPAARDPRSGGGWYKQDIRIPGFDFALECKNQQTIKLRDWWEQTTTVCPVYKTPMLVIAPDEYTELAVVKLQDILGLLKQIEDDRLTITELRSKP